MKLLSFIIFICICLNYVGSQKLEEQQDEVQRQREQQQRRHLEEQSKMQMQSEVNSLMFIFSG